MSYLKINGVTIKAPKSFEFAVMDLDGQTERTASGRMKRDRIATKRKLELEWGHLSDSEISAILSAVSPVFFQVTYPDALTGNQQTRTFYVGDRTAPSYSWSSALQNAKWEGLKMSFVEQ